MPFSARHRKRSAKFADCLFLCVGNSEMSENVLLGSGRCDRRHQERRNIVADASTIAPTLARKIAKVFEKKGAFYLDAPCTGSTPGAQGGTLTFHGRGPQEGV